MPGHPAGGQGTDSGATTDTTSDTTNVGTKMVNNPNLMVAHFLAMQAAVRGNQHEKSE